MTKLHIVNRAGLPLRADLLIAGAYCNFATNSEQILESVSRWRSPGQPPSERTFEMNVLLDSSLPCHQGVQTRTHFRGLHNLVFATIGNYELFTFDLLRKQVVGAVSLASAADTTFWNSHWLPVTVGIMGTTVGVVPIHSACLDLDGKGLLIAGVSGAGKSTLSMALTRRGFSLISDDWTYVCNESGGLIAHGLSAPVKLLPDAVQHFPELSCRTPQMSFNGELAFEIAPEEFCRNAAALRSRPRWLMFLERTSAPGCNFAPYDADDAQVFFESSAERLPDQIPDASMARSAVIRSLASCAAWRVRTGESPQVTADAIRQFCERN
jgi:HPr Serine kinase C-terminal domain